MPVRGTFRVVLHVMLVLSMVFPAGVVPAAVQVHEAGQPPDSPAPTNEQNEADDLPQETASNPDLIPFDPEVPMSEAPDTILSMGIATYKIPIEAPKGRSVTPSLAIGYNSFQKNGMLGVGWDLLGIGYIQRGTKRGLNWTGDDFVVHANGSSSELVPRTSAQWGGAGHYGAKIEGAFTNYYLESPATGWIVRDRNGTVYRYGSQGSSRRQGELGIFRWYLDRIEDIHGNYTDITYHCGDDTCEDDPERKDEVYPKTIEYTKHKSGKPAAANQILLNLEERPDVQIAHGDRKVRTSRRLAGIEVRAIGALVRKYVLKYEYSPKTARSLLRSVTQYGTDYGDTGAQPLFKKEFEWQPESVVYSEATAAMKQVLSGAYDAAHRYTNGEKACFTYYQVLDLNKDGFGTLYMTWIPEVPPHKLECTPRVPPIEILGFITQPTG